jgi:hypothetical protein
MNFDIQDSNTRGSFSFSPSLCCTDQFVGIRIVNTVSPASLFTLFCPILIAYSRVELQISLHLAMPRRMETNEDPWNTSMDEWTAERTQLARALAAFIDLERVADLDGLDRTRTTSEMSSVKLASSTRDAIVEAAQRRRSPTRQKSAPPRRPELNLESETPGNDKENLPSPSPTRKGGLKPKDYLGRLFPMLAQECSFATDAENPIDEPEDSLSGYNGRESSDGETLETTPHSPRRPDIEKARSEPHRRKALDQNVLATPKEPLGRIVHNASFGPGTNLPAPPSKTFAVSKVTERM